MLTRATSSQCVLILAIAALITSACTAAHPAPRTLSHDEEVRPSTRLLDLGACPKQVRQGGGCVRAGEFQ